MPSLIRKTWIRLQTVGRCSVFAVCGALVLVGACRGSSPTPLAPSPLPRDQGTGTVVPTLRISSIVAFGDSLTAGVTSSVIPTSVQLEPNSSYPAQLLELLNQRYGAQTIRVTNAGVPGERAADAISRFQSELGRLQPDVVLIMEGTNDLDPDSMTPGLRGAEAIEAMVQDARSRGVDSILATIPPQRGASRGTEPLVSPYNDIMRQIAVRQGVPLVDVHQIISVGQCLGAGALVLSCLGDDDLHPTGQGFGLIANAFFQRLMELYEAQGAVGSSALSDTGRSLMHVPTIRGRVRTTGFESR
jgi:lysophospholipase L1-like esterase